MVFKGEVQVVERDSEKVCDIFSGEMEYWVFNPTDSIVYGFLDVYRDTTLRLQGYCNDLLVLRSPSCMHLMSSKLFSRCALVSNHEMRCVGLLMFDTIGLILMSGPVL